MKLFRFLKKKPRGLVVSREVLIEKWEEGGPEVIESLTRLIRERIAPALALEMEKAGFDSVSIDNHHWNIKYLTHRKLCSGRYVNDWESIPQHFCSNITDYDSYLGWANIAEKMVEKISEIKREVEEMKTRRDSLLRSVNEVIK